MDAIENVLFLFIKIILIRFEFLPNYNAGNFSTIDICSYCLIQEKCQIQG